MGRTITKAMGRWDFFSWQEFFNFFKSIAFARFFSRSKLLREFFSGGEGRETYSTIRNLNLGTRHKLLTWNRLQTNIVCIFHAIVLL